MMNTRPQTLDMRWPISAGRDGCLLLREVRHLDSTPTRQSEKALTPDDMLDDSARARRRHAMGQRITLYWLTNTGTSSSRSHWDAAHKARGGPFHGQRNREGSRRRDGVPGRDLPSASKWTENTYHNLISTKSTRAVTSLPGKSRSSSAPSFARRSARCVDLVIADGASGVVLHLKNDAQHSWESRLSPAETSCARDHQIFAGQRPRMLRCQTSLAFNAGPSRVGRDRCCRFTIDHSLAALAQFWRRQRVEGAADRRQSDFNSLKGCCRRRLRRRLL